MSLHKEISFESEICQHLASHGWLHLEGDATGYDRNLSPKGKPKSKLSEEQRPSQELQREVVGPLTTI